MTHTTVGVYAPQDISLEGCKARVLERMRDYVSGLPMGVLTAAVQQASSWEALHRVGRRWRFQVVPTAPVLDRSGPAHIGEQSSLE